MQQEALATADHIARSSNAVDTACATRGSEAAAVDARTPSDRAAAAASNRGAAETLATAERSARSLDTADAAAFATCDSEAAAANARTPRDRASAAASSRIATHSKGNDRAAQADNSLRDAMAVADDEAGNDEDASHAAAAALMDEVERENDDNAAATLMANDDDALLDFGADDDEELDGGDDNLNDENELTPDPVSSDTAGVSETRIDERRKKVFTALHNLLVKLRQAVATAGETDATLLLHKRVTGARLGVIYQGANVSATL